MCEQCIDDGHISAWFYEIIEAFRYRYPETDGSAAHIVVADDNVETDDIEYCLSRDEIQEPEEGFLRWMLTVPEEMRLGGEPEILS